jgi:hypothetical protein
MMSWTPNSVPASRSAAGPGEPELDAVGRLDGLKVTGYGNVSRIKFILAHLCHLFVSLDGK